MSKAVVKMVINASANEIWKIISAFEGVERFAPWVASSSVEGLGVGAKRTITMKDGVQLFERLEHLDEQEKILCYSITDAISDSPLPVKDFMATVQLQEISGNWCEVEWSATFEAQEKPEAEIIAEMEGMLSLAIKELEKLHGG